MKRKSLLEDLENVLQTKDSMKNYAVQENLLQYLVKTYPYNKDYDEVDTKAKLLNLFYSTGIQAMSIMTQHILDIKDIDKRLAKGDLTLVPEIARLELSNSIRNNYSFATKYCALHQPEKFPIYDSIVANIFKNLMISGQLENYHYSKHDNPSERQYQKGTFEKMLKEYDFFVEVYKSFMKQYGLTSKSYRDVDSYLWGAYKLPGKKFEIEEMTQLDQSKYFEYKKK